VSASSAEDRVTVATAKLLSNDTTLQMHLIIPDTMKSVIRSTTDVLLEAARESKDRNRLLPSLQAGYST
jgi:hypothetical protein